MIKQGTALEIGYFGQLRETLDPERSVAYIVGNGSDYVKINGHDRHVIGYLRGFLFSAKRATRSCSLDANSLGRSRDVSDNDLIWFHSLTSSSSGAKVVSSQCIAPG